MEIKLAKKNDIPIKIMREIIDITSYVLYRNFNNLLSDSVFPSTLKEANITPVYKKEGKYLKENYRPISILPSVCKVRSSKCTFLNNIIESAMWFSKRI